jgi:virulence factor
MIRLGIVDFDSSHSIEFTRRINHVSVDSDQFVEGARVVLGCPGTSLMSPERIPVFTRQIEAAGVELVESPEEMLGKIDAVLVLSLCGGVHFERVRPFLEAGIPAFVDKPFACSWNDALEMVRLAEQHHTFVCSSSGLRFAEEVVSFQNNEHLHGPLHGLVSYGPAKRAEGNPGLFHYGIHPSDLLITLMGTGCERVTNEYTNGAEVVTGFWRDGRVATLRGNRQGATAYGFLAFCENAVVHQSVSSRYAYRNLCQSIVGAVETNLPPVSNAITLEIVKFILAALQSERSGGEPVALELIGTG